MRTTGILRFALLAVAAATVCAQDTTANARHLSVADTTGVNNMLHSTHISRVLHKKKHATPAPAEEEEETETETAAETTAPPKKKKAAAAEDAPAPTTAAPTTQPPAPTTTAPAPTTAAPTTAPTTAPTAAPTAAETEEEETPAPTPKPKKKKKAKKDAETGDDAAPAETPAPTPSKTVRDKRTKGNKNEGVIDGSSEGSAEIDKIDLRNQDGWVSVYTNPPLLIIKASLYAFISYNDSKVCDSFNMSLDAVEQKPDGNGTFKYHVVTYINCTKNSVDETPGRFLLNFIPEGRRLLLTECGHREEGEIVNWLKITGEVPECMTPGERRAFLAQPMKHIHASNGTTDGSPKKTDFFARLEELDGKEVAIAGSATVALIAVIVVVVVVIMRKRKAQKDLERTIAGAKADHADEDEDKDDDKALNEKAKKKGDEEGSFVNSPAVKV